MSVLSAVQSLVVMLLWLYVGRFMLGRWIDDPKGADLDLMGDGSYRQSPAHKRRQIAATLVYWMAAVCCFWLAVAQLLPQQPKAAAKGNQAQNHANDAGDGWAARMPPQDSARHEPLAVLVVYPFSDTNRAGPDGQPDQRFSKSGVVADCHDADQHGPSDEGQRAIPLVRAESLFHVHGSSLGPLEGNGDPEGGRP